MLQPWMLTAKWEDSAAVYRPTQWDPKKYIAVEGEPGQILTVQGRRKTTSNFDRMKSEIGQSNLDNFDTSDEWRYQDGPDIRAADVILINGADWMKIAGDPMRKKIFPRRVAFITTTPAPKIVDGFWKDNP